MRRFVLLTLILLGLLGRMALASPPKQSNRVAIIAPFLDRQHRDDWESTLQLARLEFVVFLYQDAAVVYSEADFVNTGTETMRTELGLPSAGFIAGAGSSEQDISRGILGVRLWVAGERFEPEIRRDGDVEWFTITPVFKPQVQTRVKSLFWVETTVGNDPADRAVGILLSHAAIWKDVINSVDVTVVLKEGLTVADSLFEADPDNYSVEDSVLTWSFWNIDPTANEDISILYSSHRNQALDSIARESLSRFIIEQAYDEMLEYVREIEED